VSFLYPLGLLGLIAVPVLIIIYIIKNKYTEQVVSATYIWTLSERFLKRKNPINKLNGLISLILQIIAVILITMTIAQPVITLPNAAKNYCFILDASGSMNIVQSDETRFDISKNAVRGTINNAVKGSSYTLIYVGDTTEIYSNLTDKDYTNTILDGFEVGYSDVSDGDILSVAQNYFNENNSSEIYLYTDISFDETSNINVINVGKVCENYAITDTQYVFSGSKVVVTGSVISYTSDATVKLKLAIGDSEVIEQTLTCTQLEATPFTFESENLEFSKLVLTIDDGDGLALDNEVIMYNSSYDSSYKTLIVSDEPFFMQALLLSHGNVQVDVVTPDEYDDNTGYGLYIFDSCVPEVMPKDGAVWFFNPTGSVANSGFSYNAEQELTPFGRAEYNTDSSTKVQNLLSGAVKGDIYINKYVKCRLDRSFTTILKYDGNPLVFAGTNVYGNREVVFAFDLHYSDFPLSVDYSILGNNLLNYTFPAVLDNTSYYCGDVVTVNVLANCKGIRIDKPNGGNADYLDTDNDIAEYTLTEVGEYTITLTFSDTTRTFNLYSSLGESERYPTTTVASLSLTGEKGDTSIDGIYDDLLIIFIILAVVYIADWMVYCYEQYQLR
jgi:hypothetical protein